MKPLTCDRIAYLVDTEDNPTAFKKTTWKKVKIWTEENSKGMSAVVWRRVYILPPGEKSYTKVLRVVAIWQNDKWQMIDCNEESLLVDKEVK